MAVTIRQGDVLDVLRTLPDACVQCVVTSPPYFNLRSYLPSVHPDKAREVGLEATPAAFVERLVGVFREVRRVLRRDGTCWVNLGDSYAGSGKGPTGHNGLGDQERRQGFVGNGQPYGARNRDGVGAVASSKPKDLCLVPERFALAMQADGWYVRSRIAWVKAAPMPESVRDRPTSAWEHIWLFSKTRTYYYDAEAVRQPAVMAPQRRLTPQAFGRGPAQQNGRKAARDEPLQDAPAGGANLRNAWVLGPEPLREAHYAAYPSEIPRRAILAGTSARGACAACGAPWQRVVERTSMVVRRSAWGARAGTRTAASGTMVAPPRTDTAGWQPGCRCGADVRPCVVLDPFLGSGTTALVADRLGRDCIGIELNPEYVVLARRRIDGDAPLFADVEVSA